MKANYHTHLKLCGHAEGMSEDYVKVAIIEGYEILGMSDRILVISEGKLTGEFDREEATQEIILKSAVSNKGV